MTACDCALCLLLLLWSLVLSLLPLLSLLLLSSLSLSSSFVDCPSVMSLFPLAGHVFSPTSCAERAESFVPKRSRGGSYSPERHMQPTVSSQLRSADRQPATPAGAAASAQAFMRVTARLNAIKQRYHDAAATARPSDRGPRRSPSPQHQSQRGRPMASPPAPSPMSNDVSEAELPSELNRINRLVRVLQVRTVCLCPCVVPLYVCFGAVPPTRIILLAACLLSAVCPVVGPSVFLCVNVLAYYRGRLSLMLLQVL